MDLNSVVRYVFTRIVINLPLKLTTWWEFCFLSPSKQHKVFSIFFYFFCTSSMFDFHVLCLLYFLALFFRAREIFKHKTWLQKIPLKTPSFLFFFLIRSFIFLEKTFFPLVIRCKFFARFETFLKKKRYYWG